MRETGRSACVHRHRRFRSQAWGLKRDPAVAVAPASGGSTYVRDFIAYYEAKFLTPEAFGVSSNPMRGMGVEKLARHDLRRTCAKLCRWLTAISGKSNSFW